MAILVTTLLNLPNKISHFNGNASGPPQITSFDALGKMSSIHSILQNLWVLVRFGFKITYKLQHNGLVHIGGYLVGIWLDSNPLGGKNSSSSQNSNLVLDKNYSFRWLIQHANHCATEILCCYNCSILKLFFKDEKMQIENIFVHQKQNFDFQMIFWPLIRRGTDLITKRDIFRKM